MGILRAFLAFSVLAWHIRPAGYDRLTLLDGGVAVIVFFIISGFYMSMVVNEKYLHLENGRRRFFINRLLRIFPAYFAAMILQQVVFSLDGVKTVFTGTLGLSHLTQISLIGMNLMKFGQDYWQTLVEHIQTNGILGRTDQVQIWASHIFGDKAFIYQPGTLLVGQGWSLASELTYYLIAPLIAGMAWYYTGLIGVASFAVRIAFFVTLGSAYMGCWRTKFFPALIIFFILGHFSYQIYRRILNWKHRKILENLTVTLWIGLLVSTIWRQGLLVGVEYDSTLDWIFYSFTVVSIPFLFSKTMDSRFDNLVGEFAYPIYLLHPIAIQIAFAHKLSSHQTIHYIQLIGVCLLMSYGMIISIERPINRLRQRISRRERREVLNPGIIASKKIATMGSHAPADTVSHGRRTGQSS
jgi:peptidoglycan/LPS O-acetylase OafA/YrhL